MSGGTAAEPALPDRRPPGVGPVTWTLAQLAAPPGLRYGLLLVAMATGLVGSGAMVGHAVNAPSLYAYRSSGSCGAEAAAARRSDCRTFVSATIVEDHPFPLGVHALVLSIDGRTGVFYGRAHSPPTSSGLRPGGTALLVLWRGRAARVFSADLTLEPFDGPPGTALLLIVLAVGCQLVCALALILQGVAWRLRSRVLPGRPDAAASGPPGHLVYLAALGVALVAGRTGHWTVAVPLHAICGLAVSGLLAVAGLAAARSLAGLARGGLDALSTEPALELGADATLAAVLVAVCVALSVDLVVTDLLTLPR